MLRGHGIKTKLKTAIIRVIKKLDVRGVFYNTPKACSTLLDQNLKGYNYHCSLVFAREIREEPPPLIWNYKITSRFSSLYNRICPEGFVVEIPRGKVAGHSSNWIIYPDNTLSIELSREFGAFGGLSIAKSKLITETLKFDKVNKIHGKVAVITTCGYNNFHHWNYDCMSRLQMLNEIMDLDDIDYFVIHHSNHSFQLESIKLFGIDVKKIICVGENSAIEADLLFVPSLPSNLGTINPWVIQFLRSFYFRNSSNVTYPKRIYISRKNVTSRKVINNNTFQQLLSKYGFVELFPEDFSVSDMAQIVSRCETIISIHGSGLSNICFMNPKTTVVDILAPYHQDGYYWQITNICGAKYIGFFAEGAHPNDDIDLVRVNIDNDLLIDMAKLEIMIKSVFNEK